MPKAFLEGALTTVLKRHLPLTLLIVATTVSLAAADPAPPEGWTIYPTPKPQSCEWSRAHRSERNWRVRLENGRLVIEPNKPPAAPTGAPKFNIPLKLPEWPNGEPCEGCVARVDDGWLVGYDFGEWGGRLWWTDATGRNAHAVPYDGRCRDVADTGPMFEDEKPDQKGGYVSNVTSVQRIGATAFAFTGYSHMGFNLGELHRIERRAGRWHACMLRNLEGATLTTLQDTPDAWLVTTGNGFIPQPSKGALLRVQINGTLRRLAEPIFLQEGPAPTSMVKLADGTLYLGMRHFVARMIPQHDGNYREELLTLKDRPPFDFNREIDDPTYEFYGHVPSCMPSR